MKKLKDLQLKSKRIILRVDINAPIEQGKIVDDTRIREVLPTINYILNESPSQLTILAHQGRKNTGLTLDLHAQHLVQLLNRKITKVDSWSNHSPQKGSNILLLENVRLSDESDLDEEKRKAFAKILSSYGEVYINDAFSVCHRDHASIVQLPALVKERAMGLLLEKEMMALEPLIESRSQSLTMILGGAKLETKLPLIQNFIGKAQHFLLGGGIANTFLYAQGKEVGGSLCEKDQKDFVMQLLAREKNIIIPSEVIASKNSESEPKQIEIDIMEPDLSIFDIGEKAVQQFIDILQRSAIVVWNGPLGFFEKEPFGRGSIAIAKALAYSNAKVIIGGGDTIAVLKKAGLLLNQFHHVSTGGGAMLQFLGGKKLPGIEALQ